MSDFFLTVFTVNPTFCHQTKDYTGPPTKYRIVENVNLLTNAEIVLADISNLSSFENVAEITNK